MKKIHLSIPTPCHENWDNMTQVEKGKFCGSCQKTVVDFSAMSDREVAMFFKKPSTGSVCGRFMEDQLGRDIEIPKKRIPWVKYFFQFALPAFLISARATAQGKVLQKKVTVQRFFPGTEIMGDIEPTCIPEKKKMLGDTTLTLRKNVFNDTLVLPEVVVIGYNERQMGKVSFQSTVKQAKVDSGFYPQEKKSFVLGGAVGGVMVCRKSSTIIDSFFNKIFHKDKDAQSFKLYPNPVKNGSTVNIEWKQNETGYFVLQLFSQSGQMAFTKEMWVDDKATVLDFELPHVASGNYFLRMTSKQSGKSFSQKIIIR